MEPSTPYDASDITLARSGPFRAGEHRTDGQTSMARTRTLTTSGLVRRILLVIFLLSLAGRAGVTEQPFDTNRRQF